jgi:hypothetical protein
MVPFMRPGNTFVIGILHSIIGLQAKWRQDDLERHGLL